MLRACHRTANKPDQNQLDADLAFASNDNTLVFNLTMWRNNIIAHRSAKNLIKDKDLNDEYPLLNSDLITLLDSGLSKY